MSHLASEQFRHGGSNIRRIYYMSPGSLAVQLLLHQGERLSKSRGKCRRRIELQEAEKWSRTSSAQEKWRTSAYLAWRSQGRPGRICTEGKIAAADLDSEGFGWEAFEAFRGLGHSATRSGQGFRQRDLRHSPKPAVAYVKVFQGQARCAKWKNGRMLCARGLFSGKGY